MDFLDCLLAPAGCSAWDGAKIAAVLVLVVLGWVKLVPAARLLARTIYRGRGAIARYLAAIRDLVQIFFIIGLKEKLISAARFTVEWQVLNPPRAAPTLLEALGNQPARAPDEREGKAALRRARLDWARAMVRYRQFTRPAWRQERRLVLSGLLNPDVPSSPRVRVNSVFDLVRVEDEIKHYFDTLARERSARVDHRDRFLSEIEFAEGFLAPLHLVSGLQDRFDEDWEPIINHYDRRVAELAGIDDNVRRLRARTLFQFVCWIAWGPSISPCTCRRWHGWRSRPVFQYGYGDENNSIAVVVDDKQAAATMLAHFDAMRPWLAQRMSVVGALHWGPSLTRAEFCPVQQDIQSVEEERLVLQCKSLSVSRGGSDAEVNARYYSAYLWVMFELVESDEGRPGAQVDSHPWERLLPFFEHGNLAEPSTLRTLKEQLARKALAVAREILEVNPGLQLRYVCAVDDSNCFEEAVLSPMQFPESEGRTIRDLMQTHQKATDATLSIEPTARPSVSARLVLDSAASRNPFASCLLPQIVSRFQEEIAGESGRAQVDAADGLDSHQLTPAQSAQSAVASASTG